MTEKTALMLAYNAARRLAKQRKLDTGRVNRGFGLAQSRSFRKDHGGYECTDRECNCPDSIHRNCTCKHQLALGLILIAEELCLGTTMTYSH